MILIFLMVYIAWKNEGRHADIYTDTETGGDRQADRDRYIHRKKTDKVQI